MKVSLFEKKLLQMCIAILEREHEWHTVSCLKESMDSMEVTTPTQSLRKKP